MLIRMRISRPLDLTRPPVSAGSRRLAGGAPAAPAPAVPQSATRLSLDDRAERAQRLGHHCDGVRVTRQSGRPAVPAAPASSSAGSSPPVAGQAPIQRVATPFQVGEETWWYESSDPDRTPFQSREAAEAHARTLGVGGGPSYNAPPPSSLGPFGYGGYPLPQPPQQHQFGPAQTFWPPLPQVNPYLPPSASSFGGNPVPPQGFGSYGYGGYPPPPSQQQYPFAFPPAPSTTTTWEADEPETEAQEPADWDQQAWLDLREQKALQTNQRGGREVFRANTNAWQALDPERQRELATSELSEAARQHVEERHVQGGGPNRFKSQFLPGLDLAAETAETAPRLDPDRPQADWDLAEPVGIRPRPTAQGRHVTFELQRGLRRAINPAANEGEGEIASQFPSTAERDAAAPLVVPADPRFLTQPHVGLASQAVALGELESQPDARLRRHLTRLRGARDPARSRGRDRDRTEYENRGLLRQHAQFLQQHPQLRDRLIAHTEGGREVERDQGLRALREVLANPPEDVNSLPRLNTYPEFVDLTANRRARSPSPIRIPVRLRPPRQERRPRDERERRERRDERGGRRDAEGRDRDRDRSRGRSRERGRERSPERRRERSRERGRERNRNLDRSRSRGRGAPTRREQRYHPYGRHDRPSRSRTRSRSRSRSRS